MLWVDKHRPKDLTELDCHPHITDQLTKLGASNDFPHLLFHGPSGAGKKTRAMGLLKAHFGETINSVKLEHKTVQVSSSKSIDITTLASPHHIDINPSDAGNYDRVIVMEMIREIAETVPLVTTAVSGKGATQGAPSRRGAFKVVILNEVDKMTRQAQQALRRTMEKYMSTCRLILLCNSPSRLIAPLRSRCLAVRVPAQPRESVKNVVQSVAKKESLPDLSPQFTNTIVHRSEGNLRRAVLMLEAAKMCKVNLAGDGADIPVPDWKVYIQEIAQDIVHEQTPKQVFLVRQKYYELLGQCIPGELILKEVTTNLLLSIMNTPVQMEIVKLAATYDHHLALGTKPIMHLEAFTAQVMRVIKAAA